MADQIFHIFRNNPLGRETLFQSIYFSQMTGSSIIVYIPEFTKFLMYFDSDVVQVDLDHTYLTSPDTAIAHATELLEAANIKYRFLSPKHYTASTLPDIPTNFNYFCCPRSISDLTSKIGLGYIGPKVRRITKSASFPILITSPSFKKWTSIAVFYGGSQNAQHALRLGFAIQRITNMKLSVFTQAEYDHIIKDSDIDVEMEKYINNWHIFEKDSFEENLYHVPHDALVIAGAYGHGLIKDFVFGSKLEKLQSILCNNMLIVGPNSLVKSVQ